MRLFLWLIGSPQWRQETALYQVVSLGYKPSAVSDIVLTHLHLDHAGGLPDFPQARVHLHRGELVAATQRRRLVDLAYDPQHWSHGPNWIPHEGPGETWNGFETLPVREGLEPEIRLVPLPGHTRGHCGVAIQTERGWLLHCGDAASPFHPATDLHDNRPSRQFLRWLPPRLARGFLGDKIGRLRSLLEQHGDQVQAISSHDAYSLARFANSKT
jgi:glyoxylase-like metal-dependent hydrolase (beta-lactamase superfamily II)